MSNTLKSWTDTDRLRWLLAEELLPEGFNNVSKDIYEFAFEVAEEAGRDEPTDEDFLEALRRLLDCAIDGGGG